MEGIQYHLLRPVRIAVLGEENSGKSLLLNYLLRHQILPTSNFSPDDTEILIRYAAEPCVYVVNQEGRRTRLTSRAFGALSKAEAWPVPKPSNIIYQASKADVAPVISSDAPASMMFARSRMTRSPSRLIDVGLPIEILKDLEMIEVRNIPDSQAATPASAAFRQVDICIWCTLATQAWKETEAMSWRRIPPVRRRSALMLVTYKDAIGDHGDEGKILERLYRATASLFSDVKLVSFKDAVAGLLENDPERASRLQDASNVEAVERALLRLVHERQALRMRKASRLLHMIADKLHHARAGSTARDIKRSAVAERLQQIADMLLNIAPSASLEVQAA
ncbi:MAG: hypothetical protein KTR19_08705 [Hyphomicrobiales bacterium]|nr:hypothetical protein [Hyphomicrobiales bacterium]